MTHRARPWPVLIAALIAISLILTALPAVAASAPVAAEDQFAPLAFGDISRLFTTDSPDGLGWSVAIDGDTALVGAPWEGSKGAVYVFTRTNAAGWTQRAKITAPDAYWGDQFGISVALEDGVAVIGAAGRDSFKGSVYVFTGGGALWNHQTRFAAADSVADNRFGSVVSLSNGTLLVGAPYALSFAGAAYVFTGSGSSWSQQAKLLGTATGYAQFGDAVALSGDTALIGAYSANSYKGAAYLFTRSGGTWSLQKTFTGDASSGFFGCAVALSGSTAIVGASHDSSSEKGVAFVYTGSGANWTQQARLAPSGGAAGDRFGDSVALEGDTAVVGAWGDSSHGEFSGSAYVFRKSGYWQQVSKIAGGDVSNRRFGWSVAISGSEALIGACGFHQPDVDGRAYALDMNRAPVAVDDWANCAVGALAYIPVLDNDYDPDGDTVSVAAFTQPAYGMVAHNTTTGQLIYIPSAGWEGADWFTYTATDGKDVSAAARVTVTVGGAGLGTTPGIITPIEGATRIETAIAASRLAFESSEYVLLATAFNWPDALSGAALAGALEAPILLTSPTSLSDGVAEEIARLGATDVIILGGMGAISSSVADAADELPGVSVERIFGDDRYATSRAIAARTIADMASRGGFDGTALVATGVDFPDALAASPLATAKGWPIYLADPTADGSAGLVSAMATAGVEHAIIVGGTSVVPPAVETALVSLAPNRLAGADRYATAVAVATYGVESAGLSWDRVAIATGTDFPDGLAGGVMQGHDGSVLMLTPGDALDDRVREVLTSHKDGISQVRVIGGPEAVSQAVRMSIASIFEE